MNTLSSRHPHRDGRDAADGRVRIPADVDRPDRILAGLTARQVALLAVPLLVVWAGYLTVRVWVPLPVFAAFLAVVALKVKANRQLQIETSFVSLACRSPPRFRTRGWSAGGRPSSRRD